MRRFTPSNPCPICDGHPRAQRGQGVRCAGFLSDDGQWAYCTREERAGALELNTKCSPPAYAHRLRGPCRCGITHGEAPPSPVKPAPSGSRSKERFDSWSLTATYDYLDPAGTLAHQTLRYKNPKTFRQRRPTVPAPEPKNPKHWVWSLEGITTYLYRLPELLAADRSQPVFICEGEKDVDRAIDHLGLVATTCPMGAGKWRDDYNQYLKDQQVVILPDNDPAGKQHARQVAQSLEGVAASIRVVELPGLPPKGDLSDWIDFGGTREALLNLVSATNEYDYRGDQHNSGEGHSVPHQSQPVMPSMGVGMIPTPLRGWIVDAASRCCVPVEYVACPAMVALSAVVGRSVGIRPDPYNDHLIVPNLWGALVGGPGEFKSPTITEALKPISRLATVARDEYKQRIQAVTPERKRLEAEIRGLERATERAAKDGEEEKLEELRTKLAARSAELERTAVVERRYIVRDTTVEKLVELLGQNPRGLLQVRDELAGWLRTFDKAGREGDRELFLEAWNGDGDYCVDRIGRGSIHVPALTLSVFGGIQPGKLESYRRDALRGGRGDDGLLQRFQLLVWPDGLPPWQQPNRWPDQEAKDRAFQVYEQLDTLDPAALGAQIDDSSAIPYYRFSIDAQGQYKAWRTALEDRLRSGALNGSPAFAAHIGKYRSLIPSLALLFHLIDIADGKAGGPVSVEALELAVEWGVFLEEHARKLYAPEFSGQARLGSLGAQILDAIESLEDRVVNGRLPVKAIIEAVNARRAQPLTPQMVGKRLRAMELTGEGAKMNTGAAAMLWEPERIARARQLYGGDGDLGPASLAPLPGHPEVTEVTDVVGDADERHDDALRSQDDEADDGDWEDVA